MLKITNDSIDLGTIQFGKVYDFDFTIENNSGRDIKIEKIVTSCSSCTKATAPKIIKADQSATMKVTYTPGVVGQTKKHIDIFYDDDQKLTANFKALVNG